MSQKARRRPSWKKGGLSPAMKSLRRIWEDVAAVTGGEVPEELRRRGSAPGPDFPAGRHCG